MRVCVYMPLLYGAEYLDACLRQIHPHVNEILILYTSKGSFGRQIAMQCPDSEETLKEIAYGASDKVTWVNVTDRIFNEGVHKDYGINYAREKGYDIAALVEADEVWDSESFKRCLDEVYNSPEARFQVRGYVNFWRTFDWACYDHFIPTRFHNLRNHNNLERDIKGTVYHFSTCQRKEVMDYKYLVYGHADEIRKGWLQEKYYGWKVGDMDLHPTSNGLWNAEPFDKNTLPDVLKAHPNFNITV